MISPDIKKTSVRIDASGNEIHPRTKQILQPAELPYVPPELPVVPAVSTDSSLPTSSSPNFCPNCGFKLK